ncbi:hypothetical protein RCO28_34425 [Streptomyces sp. LHD-70]|uniref:type II toxin-antitoxin system RelE family toxin n=1 Tax=Streptomyces sp. LHD-70 TaxID=3072140 RepID=UPI00280CE3B7|nr:hypothetical protein [Streptomyces sp. LHD-70]MDQ8707529.1 hypothetical protein [Streptomyces sp. LHD-70]
MPTLALSTGSQRFLHRLRRGDRRQAVRVRATLERLRAGDQITGTRRLTGNRRGQYRACVGKLRILYEPAGDTVHVITIDYRRSAYGGGAGHAN